MCVCVCIHEGGLLSGVGEKPSHPPQHCPINKTDAHINKPCGCRHKVTWPQRAESLSQLISIGMKRSLVEVALCFSWSLPKQEAHSSVHPRRLGKPPGPPARSAPTSSTYTRQTKQRQCVETTLMIYPPFTLTHPIQNVKAYVKAAETLVVFRHLMWPSTRLLFLLFFSEDRWLWSPGY